MNSKFGQHGGTAFLCVWGRWCWDREAPRLPLLTPGSHLLGSLHKANPLNNFLKMQLSFVRLSGILKFPASVPGKLSILSGQRWFPFFFSQAPSFITVTSSSVVVSASHSFAPGESLSCICNAHLCPHGVGMEQHLLFRKPPAPAVSFARLLKTQIDLLLGTGFRPGDLAVESCLQRTIAGSCPSLRTSPC